MKTQYDLGSIADLPIEERHAIVVSWLNTTTDFYTRAAEQRDALLAALKDVLADCAAVRIKPFSAGRARAVIEQVQR